MMVDKLKNILTSFSFVKNLIIKRDIKNGALLSTEVIEQRLDEASKVHFSQKTDLSMIKVGLVVDFASPIQGYEYNRSYDPKFRRFLNNNNIPHVKYDILGANWIESVKDIDVIVWHTKSDPNTQEIAFNKIYFLEKIMGKICIPSIHELWSYEDKINSHYLYRHYNLPEIPTFVTHSKKEALEFAEKTDFPLISKLKTGSASYGVFKINRRKDAVKLINKVFSRDGNKTYFSFNNQKNYIYFQKFIKAEYDLRIFVAGDKLVGYYRYPNKGDYRASGAGNYQKKEIPFEALELAYEVKNKLNVSFLATDLLYSEVDKQYLIIESSIFIGIDTPEQLVIDGVPGYYERIKENSYLFKEGKYWLQEFMLKYRLEQVYNKE